MVQGIIGWYMVKSGLVNDVTVSHYRLSLHLSIALIIDVLPTPEWPPNIMVLFDILFSTIF